MHSSTHTFLKQEKAPNKTQDCLIRLVHRSAAAGNVGELASLDCIAIACSFSLAHTSRPASEWRGSHRRKLAQIVCSRGDDVTGPHIAAACPSKRLSRQGTAYRQAPVFRSSHFWNTQRTLHKWSIGLTFWKPLELYNDDSQQSLRSEAGRLA